MPANQHSNLLTALLTVLVAGGLFSGLATAQDHAAPNATVRTLMEMDSLRAIATEQEALSKAQAAAKKNEDNLRPPMKLTVDTAAKPNRNLMVVSITGITGQRRVVVTEGKERYELVENAGPAYGMQLNKIEGRCAVIEQVPQRAVQESAKATKPARSQEQGKGQAKAATAKAEKGEKLTKICYQDSPAEGNLYTAAPLPELSRPLMPSPLAIPAIAPFQPNAAMLPAPVVTR